MALGTGAISMRDVFFEINGRYPNTGETYNLIQLAGSAGLPSNLLAFRGYSGKAKVQVFQWAVTDYPDYCNVTWRFTFDKAMPASTLNVRETFTSYGNFRDTTVNVPAGSTYVEFTNLYWRDNYGYDAIMEVLGSTTYDLGSNYVSYAYIQQSQLYPSSMLQ